MSDTETTGEDLPDLEPLGETTAPQRAAASKRPTVPPAPDYPAQIFQRMFAGMPPPAFNPSASKEYYRFLFAGLLITLGSLMPFDADWSHLGYRSFAGAFSLVVGVGIVWSAWAAIHVGIFRVKWVLLAAIVFVWALFHMISAFPAGAVESWGDLLVLPFPMLSGGDESDPDRFHKFGNALQEVGPGKVFIFVGALVAEFTFVKGIFGGRKTLKAQNAARRR